MNYLDVYRQIFKDIFAVDESVLNDTFNFGNVDVWDSLTHLTLISELEAAFNVIFETDDILHYGGYLNGIEILKKYGINFEE